MFVTVSVKTEKRSIAGYRIISDVFIQPQKTPYSCLEMQRLVRRTPSLLVTLKMPPAPAGASLQSANLFIVRPKNALAQQNFHPFAWRR